MNTIVRTVVGSETDSYSPGLTMTPRSVTVSVSASYDCPLGFSTPQVSSASISYAKKTAPQASCLEPAHVGAGAVAIRWSTGQVSQFAFTLTDDVVDGALVQTQTGSIISGLFAGDQVVRVTTGTPADLTACLATGVPRTTSDSTITVLASGL
ncbi:hypothetical protein [Curtobacterium sp. MCBD17_028]|uniref:hypothetical protein n=1 Tax=Curtobacterium sp. MCBD17_028 TaxID=2175670 RepID=UPI0015E8B26E|nr:hypothetical protein [Curtobacterium sp. MCBD17_028]